MPLKIERIGIQHRGVLQNLLNMYLHELSEFTELQVDEQGNFQYEYLSCYWVEPERHPYFIRVKGKIAGFVLVRDTEAISGDMIHTIAEFFVLNSYRRLGIGEEIARMVFDRITGKWRVAVGEENYVARIFWKRVLWRYTGGQQQEFRSPEWTGPIYEFHSPGVSIIQKELAEEQSE